MKTPSSEGTPVANLDRVILTHWEPEVYSPVKGCHPVHELLFHSLFYGETLIKDSDLVLNAHIKEVLNGDKAFSVFEELLKAGLVRILRVPIPADAHQRPINVDEVARPITARAQEISLRKGLKSARYVVSESDGRFFARLDNVLTAGTRCWRYTRDLPSANPFAELLGSLLSNRTAYELDRFPEFHGIDNRLADVLVRCCNEPGYWIQFLHDRGRPPQVGVATEFYRFGAYSILKTFSSEADNLPARNLIQSVFNTCYCDNEGSAGRWGGRLIEAPLESQLADHDMEAIRVETLTDQRAMEFPIHPGIVDAILRTKQIMSRSFQSSPDDETDLPVGVPILQAEAELIADQLRFLTETFAETVAQEVTVRSRPESLALQAIPVAFEAANQLLGLGILPGIAGLIGTGVAYPGVKLSRAVRVARVKAILEKRLQGAIDVRCSKVQVLSKGARVGSEK